MAQMALSHAAKIQNVATPDGSMSHDKMLDFVNKTTKMGLQHFDSGGGVAPGTTLNAAQGSGGSSAAVGANTGLLNGTSLANDYINTIDLQHPSDALNPITGLFNATQNNFQAQAAPIQQGTNAAQLNQAYQGVQGALGTQQGLVNANQAGIGQGLASQNTLANQYAQQAAGQGPNPAQAALNQATGQNIQQQAALAAGQRGAGANAGLIAANNAQQGAATQQQAVGQAATLQAQQQLAAEGAGANLAATQVGQGATAVQNLNQQQQNEQNILQGANTSFNNAQVQTQANVNNVNAQISQANVQGAQNFIGGFTGGGASGIMSALARGGEVKRYDGGGYVSNTPAFQPTASNATSSATTAAPAPEQLPQDVWSGALNSDQKKGSGSSGGLLKKASSGTSSNDSSVPADSDALARGGRVKRMDEGGDVSDAGDDTPAWQPTPTANPYAGLGGASSDPLSSSGSLVPASTVPGQGKEKSGGGASSAIGLLALLAKGGKVEDHYHNYFCGGGNTSLMNVGGGVKADSAKEMPVVKGDSLRNDKVPAMLSAGEVVIDRDTLKDPGPMGQMARALAAHIAKRNKGGK